MRVSHKDVMTAEEEIDLLEEQLALEYLPQWAYLGDEWHKIIRDRVRMRNRLRKLKEELEYNTCKVTE